MECDATHGHVCKYGKNMSHVSSTGEWCNKVSAKCRSGKESIDSVLMDQSHFRSWRAYLSQMYRTNPKTTTGNSYKLLDYRWANFGWGLDTSGMPVHHPGVVWLYTCAGDDMDEWHKEEPVKIVFAKNIKANGTAGAQYRPIMEWLQAHNYQFKPIDHDEFTSYSELRPLEIEKRRDLRKLSAFLAPYLTQEKIDQLYPETDGDSSPDESSDDD